MGSWKQPDVANRRFLVAAARTGPAGPLDLVRRLAGAAVDSMEQPSTEVLLLLGEALRELGDRTPAQEGWTAQRSRLDRRKFVRLMVIARSGLTGHGLNDRIGPRTPKGLHSRRTGTAMSLARAIMLVVGERTAEALAEAARRSTARTLAPAVCGCGPPGRGRRTRVGRATRPRRCSWRDELSPLLRTGGNLIHDALLSMLRALALLDACAPPRAAPHATAALQQCLDSGPGTGSSSPLHRNDRLLIGCG